MSDTKSTPPAEGEIASVQPQTKKKGSSTKWILACCGCLFLILLCIGAFTTLVGYGTYRAISEFGDIEVLNVLCDATPSELDEIYNKHFTNNYRSEVSFVEFQNLVAENEDIFGDCDEESVKIDFSDIFQGSSFNYSNDSGREVMSVKLKMNEKYVSADFVKVGEDWLIDVLEIE